MQSLFWRGGSPGATCAEYEKLKQVAEELLATLNGATSPEQFADGQKSLLFLWQELEKRKDPLHPRFPGGHRCLYEAYLEYATRIRNKALLLKPEPPQPPEAPPAPSPHPLSDEDLMATLQNYVAETTKQTFFGQDQETEEEEDQSA
jgi:hypothetical protein